LVETYELDQFATMAPVFAASALELAHEQQWERARTSAVHARRLLDVAVHIGPWLIVEARTILASVELLLGEPGDAAVLLTEAEPFLRQVPDAPALQSQVDQIRTSLQTAVVDGQATVPRLTSAEQRVLRLLSTHLSFEEIASELAVSKNTVKTQAISAYRKLGVSSRSAAVELARARGLTA
jgi:LuxR family maltose regulon positive regulatory protein